MTRSKASPDGKIAQRDVASKLVVVMVGLPARGKSYITKKVQRYLSWQQHETRIFNVGNRRRVATGRKGDAPVPGQTPSTFDEPTQAAHIMLNGVVPAQPPPDTGDEVIDQSADFFDPLNTKAFQIREQVAMETLDELLDFLLLEGGSVGILDATNSTIERRQNLFEHIKLREPKLGILFIESLCEDKSVSASPPSMTLTNAVSSWKPTCV